MTLADVLPSLRSSLPHRLDPGLWPVTAAWVGADLNVGGVALTELALRHGTPSYVLDEQDVRLRCRQYRDAFGSGAVAYAARALACTELFGWIAQEGLGLSVCSAGELAVAAAARFPADRMILHGDAKTPADLHAALDYRVGRVVVTCLSEIPRLAAEIRGRQKVLLRMLAPSGPAGTGEVPAPPQDERFGLSTEHGELDEAVGRILGQRGLELVGLDFFLGSQVVRFGGYESVLQRLVQTLAHVRDRYGVVLSELNLGGGFAVPYRDGDGEFPADVFAARCRRVLRVECDRYALALPRLTVTPGRALVARAGVALYRVLAVRREPGGHQLVAIDGGLGDNPRPALYGARYTPIMIGRAADLPDAPTTVVGRHGEAGDVVARNVPLPADLRPGDLLAVADCGAYQHAMASNYTMLPRPPLIAVRDGAARELVRRESIEEVLSRDIHD
jgi:diaminopimelate decarboxylase